MSRRRQQAQQRGIDLIANSRGPAEPRPHRRAAAAVAAPAAGGMVGSASSWRLSAVLARLCLLPAPASGGGWADTAGCIRAPPPAPTPADLEQWRAAVMPLAVMTKLSYTQTWGTYRHVDQTEAVDGWDKLAGVEENPEDASCDEGPATAANLQQLPPCRAVTPARGGMHALAFRARDGSGRVVIAFRGTDLNTSSVSGRADSCSNLMRRGTNFSALPPACHGFSYQQLDYVGSARRYVRRVLALLPPAPPATAAAPAPGSRPRSGRIEGIDELMFVGHSLGALLAALMAAEFGAWSVGFGSGGVDGTLLRDSSVLDGSWAATGCDDGSRGSCVHVTACETDGKVMPDRAGAVMSRADAEQDDEWSARQLLVMNNPYTCTMLGGGRGLLLILPSESWLCALLKPRWVVYHGQVRPCHAHWCTIRMGLHLGHHPQASAMCSV